MLVSVRLSAQCTDARVNIVTKELFEKYPTLESLAAAGPDAIEAIVKPLSLIHILTIQSANLNAENSKPLFSGALLV